MGRRPRRGRPARALQPVRAQRDLPAARAAADRAGHAYHCFCTPERLEQVREAQQKRKAAAALRRHCRRLTPAEAEAARRRRRAVTSSASRRRDEGATTVHDHLRGDITVENTHHRRFHPGQVRRPGALSPGGDGGRSPDGHHPRLPRRRVAGHFPAARAHHPRLRLGGAGLVPPVGVPQAQRQGQDEQARRDLASSRSSCWTCAIWATCRRPSSTGLR